MAISFISTASAATNTVTMSAHAAGDLIVAFAFRDGVATAPTVPAGWTSLGNNGIPGANVCAIAVGYKIAASGSETTGTWTNATGISVAVYRKAGTETWTTPTIMTNTGAGATLDYTGASFFGSYHTASQTNTEVWFVRFGGARNATDLTTNTPSSWTARGGTTTETRVMDTGGPTTTYNDSIGGTTQTTNGTLGWFTTSMRIEVWDGTGMVCMGSDAGASGTSLTMPLHATGDLILGYSDRVSATPPSLPAGYTDLSSGNANTFSSRLAYKIATSGAEASPVFTNAAFQTLSVYRNSKNAWNTIDVGTSTNGSSTTLNYSSSNVPQVTNQVTGYVRFESVNSADAGFLTGWMLRSVWNATPSVTTRDALNVYMEADTVGQDSYTITNVAWRTDTVRIAFDAGTRSENTNLTNSSVPAGMAGCFVTLVGGGGGGGGGTSAGGTGNGGAGGGGGGKIQRTFVPKASLGATYSVTQGTAGTSGTAGGGNGGAGGSSTFSTGSISLTAGGGGGGLGGSNATPTGGTAGTTSSSGITPAGTENGTAGGGGSTAQGVAGTQGVDNTGGSGAGGGGGGSNYTTASDGGRGGNALTVNGGAAGTQTGGTGNPGTFPGNSAIGLGGAGGGGGAGGTGFGANGGAGATGGTAGAGGGGGGGKQGGTGAGGAGGLGAVGYTLVEWIPDSVSAAFFESWDGF